MSLTVKRTYGSKRTSRSTLSSPPTSPLAASSSSPATGEKRKRADALSDAPEPKTPRTSLFKSSSKHAMPLGSKNKASKTLTQLHFCIDQPVLRACSLCSLSYMKGAADDEALHKAHCMRVQKGMEWGRDEEREAGRVGVLELPGMTLRGGKRARIIYFKADVGGKIGSKLATLLKTINLTLSAPDLTPAILQASKAYLLLVPSATGTCEKIVGCVIAQQISTAMAIAPPTASDSDLVPMGEAVSCYREALPTPLGIPRLFVSSAHRRQGVASKLLDAAAETFVYGCPLDPRQGQVAFTQPTSNGSAVMLKWGGGCVRIYEE